MSATYNQVGMLGTYLSALGYCGAYINRDLLFQKSWVAKVVDAHCIFDAR